MKRLILLAVGLSAAFGTASCSHDFAQKWETQKAELSPAQISKIAAPKKHIKTSCIVEINCPAEITSEYKFNNFSYPLSQILENVYNGARDVFLEPPQYGTNSFKLVIDVQEASLSVKPNVFDNGGTAAFTISLICRLYDPSEKRIYGTNIVVEKESPIDQTHHDYVFDAVYEGCKDSAVTIFKSILSDSRTVNSFKRFEK